MSQLGLLYITDIPQSHFSTNNSSVQYNALVWLFVCQHRSSFPCVKIGVPIDLVHSWIPFCTFLVPFLDLVKLFLSSFSQVQDLPVSVDLVCSCWLPSHTSSTQSLDLLGPFGYWPQSSFSCFLAQQLV